MTSKNYLAFLIEALENPAIVETEYNVDLSGRVPETAAIDIAAALERIGRAPGWSFEVLDGESSSISIDAIGGEDVNISIEKPSGIVAFFLRPSSFISALESGGLLKAVRINLLGEFPRFRTRRFEVCSWDGTPDFSVRTRIEGDSFCVPSIDPRISLVKDLANSVPCDLDPWILVEGEGSGTAWDLWCRAAVDKLALLFCSEVSKLNDSLTISLNGARRVVVPFGAGAGADNCGRRYARLSEAASWVLNPQDAEARHEVLVRRLALLIDGRSDKEQPWSELLSSHIKEALDGARIDHRAYVRSKAAESVQAMMELRKAVGEDVSRIVERTHRLSSALIASLAVLAAGLGVRVIVSVTRADSLPGLLVFILVVLLVVWGSVILQHHISSKSLVGDLHNMRRWHKNVHTFLKHDEYCALALSPALEALRLYKRTARIVKRVLVVASLLFVLLAAWQYWGDWLQSLFVWLADNIRQPLAID